MQKSYSQMKYRLKFMLHVQQFQGTAVITYAALVFENQRHIKLLASSKLPAPLYCATSG